MSYSQRRLSPPRPGSIASNQASSSPSRLQIPDPEDILTGISPESYPGSFETALPLALGFGSPASSETTGGLVRKAKPNSPWNSLAVETTEFPAASKEFPTVSNDSNMGLSGNLGHHQRVSVPFNASPPDFPPPPPPHRDPHQRHAAAAAVSYGAKPQINHVAEVPVRIADVLETADADNEIAVKPDPPAPSFLASAPVRFFDALFHHHGHPDRVEEDDNLPGYKDAALAPIMAGVKGGIKKAAPFAFLNYIFLLAILFGAVFNGKNTRIVFCDHDGGDEAAALYYAFLNVTNPSPNPGVFATVEKRACSSVDDLKATVLEHASVLGKNTVVGGVYVPAGFTSNINGFVTGSTAAISSKVTTIADEGFNPSFMNRAVNPVYAASLARYNSIKTGSFFKATPDAGIAAAAAAAPGSAARTSLLAPAQVNVIRLNTASPIGGLASTLGVIFLFVQAQVQLMMLHPMLMPLFGKVKFQHYINIRRVTAYGMSTCFAFISAALTAIFGTYNEYIDGRIWIYLFLSSWLIITTFGVTISFCQFTFGPLAPTAIGIFNALSIASAQFDAPWACLPDFFQLGRGLAMPNGVELFRCVLFGSCYNVGANVGILVANQVFATLFLIFMAKNQFLAKINGEKMQKLGHLVGASSSGFGGSHQGASNAGLGMAITSH